MRRRCLLTLLVLVAPLIALGQDADQTLDDLAQSAEQWAQENLSDDALRVLQSVDRQKAKQFFADIQNELRGPYVIDLASLKETAEALVPLLEEYEETYPYALWLKTRLDYLEAADQLQRSAAPPRPEPGKPPPRIPNPPAQTEREIWIKRIAQRPWPKAAQPYVPRLKAAFAAQKVPVELIWMAEVESSFDPRARSPDGAAGLFQLMPSTAKRYGLRTWPFDQRLKPQPSAAAAAKYLSYLHRRFKDWRLALAAYNAGEGTVDKLLAGRKTKTYDTIATRLPAETQMYVPRVEATVLRREGVRVGRLR